MFPQKELKASGARRQATLVGQWQILSGSRVRDCRSPSKNSRARCVLFRKASREAGDRLLSLRISRCLVPLTGVFVLHLYTRPWFFWLDRLDNHPVCGDTGVLEDNLKALRHDGE